MKNISSFNLEATGSRDKFSDGEGSALRRVVARQNSDTGGRGARGPTAPGSARRSGASTERSAHLSQLAAIADAGRTTRAGVRWSTSSPHAKLHGMGWQYEEHAAHEGCVIGYVARDGCAPEAGLYRELGYPRDDGDRRIACIAAGCDCGWRSPRWVPRHPATWTPFSVLASEADEDRARALWRRHLELDVIAAHPLRAAIAGVDQLLEALAGGELAGDGDRRMRGRLRTA